MTADEFRGFIANLLANLFAVGIILITRPNWQWWAYVIIAVILALSFPLIGYHPEPKPKAKNEHRSYQ